MENQRTPAIIQAEIDAINWMTNDIVWGAIIALILIIITALVNEKNQTQGTGIYSFIYF